VNPPDSRFCATCGLALTGSGAEAADGVADPLVGRIVADRYKIVALLGRGGMGVVYKVEHVHIGKLMAIKLLHGELARDKDTVKRFKREAEAASRLNHPNTVQIFDFGRDQGLTYIVMEYLEGKDFGFMVQHEGPLDMVRVARICEQVCASVGQAHSLGIVHRDLKPENIMIVPTRDRPDAVKVLDFGLAKLRHTDGGQSITRAGSIVGTPYYMAPEHIRGDDVDARADIYSLGGVMYKALAGVPPFWASTPMGVLTKHLTDDLVPPRERSSQRDLPEEADVIVQKAMAREPGDRYQSMEEMRSALVDYLISVGEQAFDTISVPGSRSTSASGKRSAVAATRDDVDYYERRIKRRGRIGMVLAALLVGGAVALGGFVYTHKPVVRAPTQESEPNDEPAQANRLPRGARVYGQIGRRIDAERGDQDVHVIEIPPGERRYVRIELRAIPNMDLALDIVKAGQEMPVLVADSTEVGGDEVVPSFPLTASRYFLRVREERASGAMPTENVSDAYAIVWDYADPAPEEEHEVNDSFEVAETISVGAERRGHVGWRGDADVYCLAADASNVTAALEPPASLDLALRAWGEWPAAPRAVDTGRAGEAERTEIIASGRAGHTCFEVAASDASIVAADPDAQYVLRVEVGAADGT
jgi:serine/threonine-protein kinase